MTKTLTRAELEDLRDAITPDVPIPEEVITALQAKLDAMIAEDLAMPAWGSPVFVWRLPLVLDVMRVRGKNAGRIKRVNLCPTLNEYARMRPGDHEQRTKILDARILAELHRWPQWRHVGAFRGVRVTRFSSRRLDEAGVDVIGGKCPVDRLVRAGVLRGDGPKDLGRQAEWRRARPGEGQLLVEVFDMAY